MHKLPVIDKTVLIACDSKAEWLLPWFFHYYNKYNNIPVTVADLGMSEKGLKFISKFTNRVFDKVTSDDLGIFWHPLNSIKSKAAYAWKPVAIWNCPAKQVLWLDLDCQVVANISEVFNNTKFSIAKDTLFHNTNYVSRMVDKGYRFYNSVIYNAGVILCEPKCDIVLRWCNSLNLAPFGWRSDDQSLLSLLLESLSINEFNELTEQYNCLSPYSVSKTIPDAKIYHRLTSHPYTTDVIRKEINETGLEQW